MKTINNQTEVWKKIPGHDGYEASTLGRIRNSNTGTIYKQALNPYTGYCSVGFWDSTIKKQFFLSVHRIVLMTFNPTSDNTLVADHINNNRSDNRLENLRWLSVKDNNSKQHARKLRSKNHFSQIHPDEYIKGEKDGVVEYFKNQRQAAQAIGCSHVLVIKALYNQGCVKLAKGWKLTYVPKSECPTLTKQIEDEKQKKIDDVVNTRKHFKNEKKRIKAQMEMNKEILKNELKVKLDEYKQLKSKSDELAKEIEHIKKEIVRNDFNQSKWDLHAVIQYTLEGEFVKEWKSVSEIKKQLGLDVDKCIKGKKDSVGGWVWRYKIAR